jgi:hypothetical protein
VKRKQPETGAQSARGGGPAWVARLKWRWRRLTGAAAAQDATLEMLKDLQWELREREARYRELALARDRDHAIEANKASHASSPR